MPDNETVLVKEQQPVNIFIADGNMQAEMIISTLKDNGIMAYGQDLGDAGFASVRYGMGRGIDDRIAIIVPSDKADNAKQVIKEMGLGRMLRIRRSERLIFQGILEMIKGAAIL